MISLVFKYSVVSNTVIVQYCYRVLVYIVDELVCNTEMAGTNIELQIPT